MVFRPTWRNWHRTERKKVVCANTTALPSYSRRNACNCRKPCHHAAVSASMGNSRSGRTLLIRACFGECVKMGGRRWGHVPGAQQRPTPSVVTRRRAAWFVTDQAGCVATAAALRTSAQESSGALPSHFADVSARRQSLSGCFWDYSKRDFENPSISLILFFHRRCHTWWNRRDTVLQLA